MSEQVRGVRAPTFTNSRAARGHVVSVVALLTQRGQVQQTGRFGPIIEHVGGGQDHPPTWDEVRRRKNWRAITGPPDTVLTWTIDAARPPGTKVRGVSPDIEPMWRTTPFAQSARPNEPDEPGTDRPILWVSVAHFRTNRHHAIPPRRRLIFGARSRNTGIGLYAINSRATRTSTP